MHSGDRWPFVVALFALAGCGRLGIDLLDQPVSSHDDGDGQMGDAALDAAPAGDAMALDGSMVRDASNPSTPDASTTDASTTDASTPDASAPDARASDAGAGTDADAPTMVACDLSGTWAAKITIQLSWQASLIEAGSGTSTFWVRFQGTQSGGEVVGTLLSCGITLPDFALQPQLASERYRMTLPNTLFDRQPPYIPPLAATLRAPSGFTVGGSLMLSDTAVLLGASLANPLTDAWPSVAALTAVDMDMNTKPGVTASYSNGAGYLYPRINFNGSQRTDLAYVAARMRLRAVGTLPSCTETSLVPTVSSLDTHVVGCRIAPAGADCTTAQRDLADMGSAVYVPGVASMSMVKVADGASCAQVRAAMP